MHFCPKCENMYYIRLNTADNNSLIYYCRACGHEESDINDNMIVSKTTFKRTDQKYANVINKYTKLDPTLPRVSNIPCPNEQCPCNRAEDPIAKEVIYIRYDDTNLKFVYLCAHCDTIWKSNE